MKGRTNQAVRRNGMGFGRASQFSKPRRSRYTFKDGVEQFERFVVPSRESHRYQTRAFIVECNRIHAQNRAGP